MNVIGSRNRTVYLFPHLPKTGGAALFQNVERYLPLAECLRLNCTHRQYYIDPRTKKVCFYESAEDFEALLQGLSMDQKAKIRFISGHDLSYGLHEQFPLSAKYFTFFREPISRTISLYNYQRSQHEFLKKMKNMDESHRRLGLNSKQWFLIDGKVPSFEDWLENSYNRDYPFYFTMTRALQQFNYLDKVLNENSWDRLFQKFFFVGLTETINEDELYLYHEMGIRCFWANRNASQPYISYSNLDRRTQERIREKNKEDFTLYEHAKKANAAFKLKHGDFPKIVKRMQVRRRGYFFIEKGGPWIKFFLRPIVKPIRDWMRRMALI